MKDHPRLTAAATARVELAKLESSKRLSGLLAAIRHNPSEDWQFELCLAYGAHAQEVFLAEMREIQEQHRDPAELLAETTRIARRILLELIPVWRDSGGEPECENVFQDIVFRSMKASAGESLQRARDSDLAIKVRASQRCAWFDAALQKAGIPNRKQFHDLPGAPSPKTLKIWRDGVTTTHIHIDRGNIAKALKVLVSEVPE